MKHVTRHSNMLPCGLATIVALFSGAHRTNAGGTSPPVLHVHAQATGNNDGTSWANAYTDLQDGLDNSTSGDWIWVASGTYTPGSLRSDSFQLVDGVEVYGGLAGREDPETFDLDSRDFDTDETILSGDLDDDDTGSFGNRSDNSYHVVDGSGNAATAVLDGFTVRGGYANGGGAGGIDNRGAGMYIDNGSPGIANCVFVDNKAKKHGGGIFITNSSAPTITDSVFEKNDLGIGAALPPREGAGVHCDGSDPEFVNTRFIENGSGGTNGGGLHLNNSDALLVNVAFLGNDAQVAGGGVQVEDSDPSFTNCLFSGNEVANVGADGGALHISGTSTVTLTNSTLSENLTESQAGLGGGIYQTGSNTSVTAENCVLWDNHDSGGTDESAQYHKVSGSQTVNYTCVKGLSAIGGTGNIDDDPLFVDANGADDTIGTEDDDLNLSSSSSCIDVGNDPSVPADSADLDDDGNTTEATPLDFGLDTRFTDDVDMGCFEYAS